MKIAKTAPAIRFIGIDALRGFAAIAVLLFHYTVDFPSKFGWTAAPTEMFQVPIGSMGVRTFFAISGFVILMSLDRAGNLASFAVSRVSRLYPAFLAAMLCTLGLVLLTGYNPRGISIGDFPSNLFFSAPFFGNEHIDAPYWTLTREFYFYILISIFYVYFERKFLVIALSGWCLFCSAWNICFADANIYHNLTNFSIASIVLNTQFAYLFAIGMFAYEFFRGERSLALVIGTIIACLTAGVAEWPMNGQHFAWSQVVKAAGYLAIIALASIPRHENAALRPLVFLGLISYSVYLLHETIGYFIISELQAIGWTPAASVASATAVIVSLATLMRHYIEVPGQRLVRNVLRVRSSANKTSAPSQTCVRP